MKQKPDLKRARQGKRTEEAGFHEGSDYAAISLPQIDFTIAAIRQEIQLIQVDMDLLLEAWQKYAGDPSPASMLRFSTAARYISHLGQQRLKKERLLTNFENMRLEFIHQILTAGEPPVASGAESAAAANALAGTAAPAGQSRAASEPEPAPADATYGQANTATH